MEETRFFKYKKPEPEQLKHFGFTAEGGNFTYETELADGMFTLQITVARNAATDGKTDGQSGAADGFAVDTVVLDRSTGEEYTLHRVAGAAGSFVGSIKEEYEDILQTIAETCFSPDVFKTPQANELIRHVENVYGDHLEFLWEKFPENAVWRRKDTGKWYGALLTVSGKKLGLDTDEKLEIVDFRVIPEELERLIDHKNYFPGYHMNKKHWCTVILDGTVSMETICSRLAASYELAVK